MVEFNNIILEKHGKIAALTLNRPAKLNAISGALIYEMDLALNDVEEDRGVKVLTIKGAGRAFSVGYDVDPSTPERKGVGCDRTEQSRHQSLLRGGRP